MLLMTLEFNHLERQTVTVEVSQIKARDTNRPNTFHICPSQNPYPRHRIDRTALRCRHKL